MPDPQKTFFHPGLADVVVPNQGMSAAKADQLFNFFKTHPLFRWKDANNDCEDRANAICILLDQWKLPHFKAWVFSGYYLGEGHGSLVNFWNYHVAAMVPVFENGNLKYQIIDPATLQELSSLDFWAEQVTGFAPSYHVITSGDIYIFTPGKIIKDKWFTRNRQNYKWTIQGLAGINGASKKGQARLFFSRRKIRETELRFRELKNHPPEFLNIH
jgi:hypothetical protein